MAIIDYEDVTSLKYATLTLPAKALIPVLATVADNKTGLLPQHYSKLNALATLAGISRRATQDALQELHNTDRISFHRIPGHTAKIIYQPIAQFSTKAGEAGDASPERQEMPLQQSLNFAPEQRHDSPKQERQLPCSLNTVLNTKKTTTDISHSLIKAMIAKYGSEPVVSIISAMKKIMIARPEKIKNPGGYLRDCCENGWIPTDKTIQEKEQIEETWARRKENQEKEDLAERARRERIKEERKDPMVQARIKQMSLSFMRLKATPSPSDSEAVSSGHARPQNEFNG